MPAHHPQAAGFDIATHVRRRDTFLFSTSKGNSQHCLTTFSKTLNFIHLFEDLICILFRRLLLPGHYSLLKRHIALTPYTGCSRKSYHTKHVRHPAVSIFLILPAMILPPNFIGFRRSVNPLAK